MDNQLPKNNMPRDNSEKTENIFQVAKKSRISNRAIWLILGLVVLTVGGAVWWSWNRFFLPDMPMVENPSVSCDLNEDGDCDKIDFRLFLSSFGKCKQDYQTTIDILADIDGDGCVTEIDQQYLFPEFTTPTKEGKLVDLCGTEPPAACAAGTRLTCVNGEWSCKEIKEKVVFGYQEECEQKTSQSCVFQNCDFIPLGKTFEETCGKDFKKGWVPKNSVLDQTPPEKQKIIGKITFSDIEGGCWGFQGDNGAYFLIGGDDKSEEIKKIPNILSKKVEIQGKIEKDIAHFCPVGDGLFKLESYRIISDNATNVFENF